MTTWQVIKALFKHIGFYKKKLVFFGVLIIVGLLIYSLWYFFGKTQAAVQFAETPKYQSLGEVKKDIIIQKNGRVLIDNKRQNKVLRFYKEYDELRVLIFDLPGQFISHFQATVHLPEEAAPNDVRQIVYAVHGISSTEAYMADSKTLVYEAREISPTATLTIVANLPKGMVTPNFWQKIEFISANTPAKIWLYIAIMLPAITIFIMVFMILKRRSDRILRIQGLLGGPPENVPPAIPGVLVDGQVGAREIAATLIDLARRGYIFIINKGGQFSFGIRKMGDPKTMPGLTPFEQVLLAKIFEPAAFRSTLEDVEMRIGRHIFSRKIAQFYLDIYNEATRAGYFIKNPAKIHLAWKYTGVVLFFLSFGGFVIGALTGADPKLGLLFWVGGMAAAGVIIKLSPFMPARTAKGSQELREWLAFREFLTARQPVAGVASLEGKFEEFLPYAIVLGAEVDWAKRFGGEPFSKPDWYESTERVVTFDSFAGQLFPLIGYVAKNLARSHEPTVE